MTTVHNQIQFLFLYMEKYVNPQTLLCPVVCIIHKSACQKPSLKLCSIVTVLLLFLQTGILKQTPSRRHRLLGAACRSEG